MRRKLRGALAFFVAIAAIFTLWIPNTDKAASYTLSGSAHVQKKGTVQGTYSDGTLALGTRGQKLRLEGFVVNFTNDTGYEGTLQYRASVQNIGWSDWTDAGNYIGTKGKSLRLEAVQFRLTDDLADNYDVKYIAHIQGYGDNQDWVENGEVAGTVDQSLRVEQIKVKLEPKSSSDTTAVISYRTHIQNDGWELQWKSDGEVSGSTGRSLRLESINIVVANTELSGGITYRTHVQDKGWTSWKSNGESSGTTGQSKRLEAIQIKLTGDLANSYDVYYRVHVQNCGWLAWAANGGYSGTAGCALRLEGIQIVLVAKGSGAPGNVGGIKSVNSEIAFADKSTLYSWKTIDGLTYYYNNVTGQPVTGWATIDGERYYFFASTQSDEAGHVKGAMALGWHWLSDADYYFRPSASGGHPKGSMVTGKQTIDGKTYYFSSDGKHIKSQFPQAVSVLNSVGWNLKAAFNWSAGMKYYGHNSSMPSYPDSTHTASWFASYGFNNYKGNCIVMACTFYQMAKELGYDCRVIHGSVVGRSGKYVPHAWTEIDIDGTTYVFDPNFTNETGRNGYKIKYGQSGTWRYKYGYVLAD